MKEKISNLKFDEMIWKIEKLNLEQLQKLQQQVMYEMWRRMK